MTRTRVGLAALAVAVCAVYAPSLGGAFVMDDATYIADNPAVTRGVPLARYFSDAGTIAANPELATQSYRPLRTLALRAVVVVAGVRPVAFKVVNLALYLVVVALTAWMLAQLVRERAAWLAATALFALAPIHVEAVLYASALGDQLSLALQLAATALALRATRDETRRLALAAASTLALAAALLMKEMAVTEAALLALLLAAHGGRAALRRGWGVLAAHVLVTLAYLALRTLVLGRVGQAPTTALTLLAGAREAPLRAAWYAWLCAAPLGHAAAYVVPPPPWTVVALAGAAWLAALLASARLAGRVAVAGVLWFLVALAPVLRLVPIFAEVADRYAYGPSVGLALLLAALGARLTAPLARRAAGVFVGAVLLLFAAGTLLEARVWQSDALVWRHAVERSPGSELARANLGAVLLSERRPELAIVELDRALALGRGAPSLHLNRGLALAALGQDAAAEQSLARVLASTAAAPTRARAHLVLATLRLRRGALDEADAEVVRARALAPDDLAVTMQTAAVFEARRRYADAALAYASAAARLPGDPQPRWLEARARLAAGDHAGAARARAQCLAIAPDDARCRALPP